MKVTLDLDQLLSEGKITREEYERLKSFAAESTGSLAFNILIGFGVIAVSGAALALLPTPATAVVIGLIALVAGIAILRTRHEDWALLANISILVGAMMLGGGIIGGSEGGLGPFLSVTAILAVAGVLAKSALLVVLATLLLSECVGVATHYRHAAYFLSVEQPAVTVLVFTLLGVGLYLSSKKLPSAYERLAIVSARTCVFLVNFGFWVGSLWGDRAFGREWMLDDSLFAFLWAVALIVAAAWAWSRNKRWVLNTVAVFAGIHFYTQWFENLGASPATVLVAGLAALGFAWVLQSANKRMKEARAGASV